MLAALCPLLLIVMTVVTIVASLRAASKRIAEFHAAGVRPHDNLVNALCGFPIFIALGIAANGIAALGMVGDIHAGSGMSGPNSWVVFKDQFAALLGMCGLMYMTVRAVKEMEIRPEDPPAIASFRLQSEFYSRLVTGHWLAVVGVVGAYGTLVRYEVTLPLAAIFTVMFAITKVGTILYDRHQHPATNPKPEPEREPPREPDVTQPKPAPEKTVV